MKDNVKKLFQSLAPYDDWYSNCEAKNEEAKKALLTFAKELNRIKPDDVYKFNHDTGHFGYLRYIIRVKKAINEKKYMRVCCEIRSLIYLEPFLQPQILKCVSDLLLQIERSD